MTVWLGGAAIGAAGALALAPYLRGELFSIRFPWWVAALLGLASAEVFWRMQSVPYQESRDDRGPTRRHSSRLRPPARRCSAQRHAAERATGTHGALDEGRRLAAVGGRARRGSAT
jgi:hypothetical protein